MEEVIRRKLEDSVLDDLQVEEHEAVVTYSDPTRPNTLKVNFLKKIYIDITFHAIIGAFWAGT